MVNLVIPNDRVTPRSDLHAGQCVAVDFVVLQDAPPTSEEVHTPL